MKPGLDGRGVTHVTVPDSGEYVLSDVPEGMVVLGWKDRPVGHQFVVRGSPQRLAGRVSPKVFERIQAEEDAAAPPLYSASVVICTRDRAEELLHSR